jgi:uncharacterized protein YlxP (DUF503 family)
MVVGVCHINLSIPGSHSLKDKRQVLKSLIARVKSKFNASVAEVGQSDVWQSASVGITVVGNERRFVNSVLDKIVDFVEEIGTVEIVSQEIEILNY